jgi:hypothetical protein
MSSIDLKDAYYSIPIATEHQKYLKFMWKDQLYCFTCLPMGLTSSPRIFTKLMKPIFATLRSKFGHICLAYIDDSLYIGQSDVECAEATLHAVELLSKLGLHVNQEKSRMLPSQTIEYLGFVIDSASMTVRLTPRKRDKLLTQCQTFSHPEKQFTIREVASCIGKLVSSFPGVEFGPLYYRNLESDKDRALKHNAGNFDTKMILSPVSLAEVRWWLDNIQSAKKDIHHTQPDVVLYTDASGVGWGATTSRGEQTAGIWSASEATQHIN